MKVKDKSFEQLLAELDRQIERDFIEFREDLKSLSVKQKMDKIFENEENVINLADDSEYQLIVPNYASERHTDSSEDTSTTQESDS